MKCKNCGNEVNRMERFCGSCGAKIEMTVNKEPEMRELVIKQIDKKKVLYPVITVIAAILIIFMIVTVIKTVGNKSFSPIGIWKSTDTPMQLKFKKGGDLQIGGFGAFMNGLHWENQGDDSYYISGEMPEIAGISIGELGTYLYYDREEKTLSMDAEGEVFVFEKVR